MINQNMNRKIILHSFAWKMLERAVTLGSGLAVQIILARILMPQDFGSLAILVAVINYASVFVQGGLSAAVVQKKELDKTDISTLMILSQGIALIFYILLYMLAPVISRYYGLPILVSALRVMSLMLFLQAYNAVQTALYIRDMQFQKIFLRSVIAGPVSGAIGILLAWRGFGLWSLVIYQLCNTGLLVMMMWIDLKYRPGFAFSWKKAKAIYSFSGKILCSNLVSGLGDTIRTMAIGKTYTSAQLAYYDKAYTYSLYSVQIINASAGGVLLPAFSAKQEAQSAIKAMARRSVSLLAYFVFPVLAGIAASAESLVKVLLTEKWLPCVPYLMIFCVLRAFGTAVITDKQVYTALGRSDILLYFEIGSLALNLMFLCFSIRIGLMAAAAGAVFAEFFASLILVFVSSRLYGYSIRERFEDLIHPLAGSAVLFAAVYAAGSLPVQEWIKLGLQGCIGVTVYAVCSIAGKDKNFTYVCAVLKKKNLHKQQEAFYD